MTSDGIIYHILYDVKKSVCFQACSLSYDITNSYIPALQ